MSTLHLRGGRRRLLTAAGTVGAGAAALLALDACGDGGGVAGEDAAAQTAPTAPDLDGLESAEDIWQALLDGNQRWADGAAVHPHTDADRRGELAEGQAPRAAVFTCVDSRVAPELVFDTGIGDLMVTRTAGNVFDPLVSESVSYGPAALDAPLLVVLGHQKCGAVTAAHEALLAAEEGGETEDHGYALPETVAALQAAYEASRGESGDPVDAMIAANVVLTVEALKEHPNLADRVADGTLTLVGAVYSLETGLVTEVS